MKSGRGRQFAYLTVTGGRGEGGLDKSYGENVVLWFMFWPVLRIRDILVRIRIRGSVPLADGTPAQVLLLLLFEAKLT
jgi:hypothetical protein